MNPSAKTPPPPTARFVQQKRKLYIVAGKERQAKVMDELDRPTFRKIGLSEYCEFISFENLASLLDKVAGFSGHVQVSILDKIAVGLPDDADVTV